MNYSIDEINRKINVAIGILFKNDAYLLVNDVHERSVSHKLAEYLQGQFPDWNVDCEYDKKGIEPKKLDGIRECSEEKKTERVLPDIIIHQRNSDRNLLVLEIKTKNQESPCDIKKLELFTSGDGEYKYDFGLFIKFNGTNEPDLRWFPERDEM